MLAAPTSAGSLICFRPAPTATCSARPSSRSATPYSAPRPRRSGPIPSLGSRAHFNQMKKMDKMRVVMKMGKMFHGAIGGRAVSNRSERHSHRSQRVERQIERRTRPSPNGFGGTVACPCSSQRGVGAILQECGAVSARPSPNRDTGAPGYRHAAADPLPNGRIGPHRRPTEPGEITPPGSSCSARCGRGWTFRGGPRSSRSGTPPVPV